MCKRCDFKNDSHRRQRCFNCRDNGVAMARQLQRLLLQHHNTRACKPLKGLRPSCASACFDCQPLLHRWSYLRYAAQHRRACHACWQQLDRAPLHLSCAPAPDGWAGRLPAAVPGSEMGRRLSQRAASTPHRPAGGCLQVPGQVERTDVLHSRPQPRRRRLRWPGEPLKRRERTQNDIAKTAAAEQTLQDAVNARADDEKYCDYRQEDWAAFRSRVDAAQLCVARYDNLLITTFKAWVAARGCVVLGGCVIGGTVLCGGRVLRWDARQSELTCFSTGNVCAVRVCRSFQGGLRAL